MEVVALFNLEGTRRKRREVRETNGGLAQLGERLPCKQEVSGSIPLISTRKYKHQKACSIIRARSSAG